MSCNFSTRNSDLPERYGSVGAPVSCAGENKRSLYP